MRLENRNVTFPQTQTVLSGVNVAEVDLNDIQAILNMRDAWKFLLDTLDVKLDVEYLCKLQERVSYREALAWGELRTGSVGISGVAYMPPIPDAAQAEQELEVLLLANLSKTEIALNALAWTARAQLFWDGNKRTALLAANKILIEHGLGILIVPDSKMVGFTGLLSAFYETGKAAQLKEFLYESCLLGITDSVPEGNASPLNLEAKASPASSGRTAAWLKRIRSERGVTQKDLARAIGISTSAIANIEQEQRKGSGEVWDKIERYFL